MGLSFIGHRIKLRKYMINNKNVRIIRKINLILIIKEKEHQLIHMIQYNITPKLCHIKSHMMSNNTYLKMVIKFHFKNNTNLT